VLKQAFEEKVQTLLVINKVDRLINELKMTPEEAYKHLNVIIDEMNAALSSYIASDIFIQRTQHDEEAQKEKAEQGAQGEQGQSTDPAQSSNTLDIDEKILEELENKVYFSPEKNNVLFASAVDNWCFDVMTFAKMIAEKLGCRAKAIQKYMWGDYYLDLKKKKIYKTPPSSKSKPIFVQYILESLWQVYDTIHSKDTEKMTKIAKSLKIQLPDNFSDLLTKDTSSALNFFLWKWLPIDEIILKNVVTLLPNPIQSQKIRLAHICKKLVNFEKESKGHSEDTKAELRKIREAVENCDNSPDAPIVIYIAKMINVPKENINEHGLVPFSQMNYESKFVGFARIFSGVLKRGSQVVVISARTKDKA
jgi:ribosome assembly protein 1